MIAALLAAAAFASPLRAQPVEKIMGFADRLVSEGRFQQAELEYRRALFYYPEAAGPELYRKMLSTPVLGRDYAEALELGRAAQAEENEAVRCVGRYFEARAEYGLRNYERAIDAFARVRPCGEPERSKAARWSELSAARLRPPPGKKPWVAGLLSAAIPGAGYLYDESPRTAAAAFVTNALFLWGTYASIRSGDAGAGAVLSLFSFAWYFGGVYGSSAGAIRYNRDAEDRRLRPLELD